jgi:hypothetical protein
MNNQNFYHMETTGHNYEEDAFGNLSSTRKLRRKIAYFALIMIAIIVIPISVRVGIDGLTDFKIHWSVIVFLLSIIILLFTAAFVPAAYSQSKEWMAFIQTFNKK